MGVNSIVSNFEVTVEKLVYGGDGLARLDGRVVFAPFVLPGERIRARAEQEKPGLVRARMLEVLEAGAGPRGRAVPGSSAAAAAATISTRRTNTSLPPSGDPGGPAAAAGEDGAAGGDRRGGGEPWGYRNRVQLHVEGTIGYREARSHKLCAVGECPVGSPKINQAIAALAGMRATALAAFMRSLECSPTSARCRSTCSRRSGRWRGASSTGAGADSGAGGRRAGLPGRVPREQQFVLPGEPAS
jgi:23S rRNA (uracil1939-C5)-methyltransferase